MPYILFSALLAFSTLANAEAVYKCTDPSGHITYTSVPCFGQNTGRAIDIQHNTLDYNESRYQTELHLEEQERERQIEARREAAWQAKNAAYLEEANNASGELKEKLLKELKSVKNSSNRELGDAQRKHKKEIEIMRNLTDLEMAEKGASPDQIKSVQQDRRIEDLEERVRKQKSATTQLLIEQQRQKALTGRW